MRGQVAALLLACAAPACASEGVPAATSDASDALVECRATALPKNGDRCDPSAYPQDRYCRLSDCAWSGHDECWCRSNGRWECSMTYRDGLGCGSPPLCSTSCSDAATD